jgi:hypothetical protein
MEMNGHNHRCKKLKFNKQCPVYTICVLITKDRTVYLYVSVYVFLTFIDENIVTMRNSEMKALVEKQFSGGSTGNLYRRYYALK